MIALAAAAPPDDIEFMMAGTLLRLKDVGCEILLWNLANGCWGRILFLGRKLPSGGGPYDKPVALYHALPHGLNDALRQPVVPHCFTDISDVLARKQAMIACHASQKEWLDETQGMNACLEEMERMSREVGHMSERFTHAEGRRQHSHLGFASEDFDPLRGILNEG
jgi:LmbE family N-acetylglucosaminyl deacetylase